MLPEKQKKAYRSFYDSTRNNDILDPKTTLLIHFASAMAFACYPWMEHYLSVAKEVGISDDEIGAAQSIVMAVSAGRVNAQFRDATGMDDWILWGALNVSKKVARGFEGRPLNYKFLY